MDIQETQSVYTSITKHVHRIERVLKESPLFKSRWPVFKALTLQLASVELETARMCAGDCLRLLHLGAVARSESRFIPAEMGATWTEDLVNTDESEKEVKTNMRQLDGYDGTQKSRPAVRTAFGRNRRHPLSIIGLSSVLVKSKTPYTLKSVRRFAYKKNACSFAATSVQPSKH